MNFDNLAVIALAPPIASRALLLIAGCICAVIGLLIGGWRLYGHDDISGALLAFGGSAIAFGFGLLSWLLLLVPGTWGWWL